ncbi:hypothetical protein TcG_08590 [Trypanosoma cruzi]|nr:hypothetical protein TcG_08590 [Trypanosoma cruzi]
MHSALRLHGIRSAPTPAKLISVPFRYGIAKAYDMTPSSTEPSVYRSLFFHSGCGGGPLRRKWRAIRRPQAWSLTFSGPSAGHHRERRGDGLELRRGRCAMMGSCGVLWRGAAGGRWWRH